MKRLILGSVSSVLLILLLAACGGGAATSGPKPVQITENEFSIVSSISTFTAGTPYHFVVKNVGKATHEFMIMPKDEGPMMTGINMPMDHMDSIALTRTNNIEPGGTETIDYTFPDSTKGTHPQLVCYLPGHYEAGMKLGVAVSS
jgi:uncharacterized cupredoxin-like copper-binding protein